MSRNAKILIVEDDSDISLGLQRTLERDKHEILAVDTGEKALENLNVQVIDLVLLDIKLPKMDGFEVLAKIKEIDPEPIVMMITALHDVPEVVKAMKAGVYDYFPKPFDNETVREKVKKALENLELRREVARLKRDQQLRYPANMLYGSSAAIQDVQSLIRLIAETPRTSILIQGESGTGKELVADAVHNASSRAEKAFIKINCSAIPEQLLESELFGHEKGAFTDAKTLKKGIFELANGGSIFLDEISSMKLSLQPKILRVLETQSFRRIGGTQDINVDVRIIAATNRDLEEMVHLGEFREDLLYRLKVMVIDIPPLRQRQEDILPLAKLFLEANNKEFNKNIKKISPEAEKLITSYPWPGNVRELKNVMERAVILSSGDTILADYLPLELKPGRPKSIAFAAAPAFTSSTPAAPILPPALPPPTNDAESLQEMERRHIIDILNRYEGNKSKAARILNISRSTLREKLKMYQIP
ncbi:sigma-54 dependent transcriptional regulator [candidate division KSB1 bacterium]|nr:sigma-54 dependent transcriptional regulator [candidate division KSB1 bacterium]